MSMFVLRHRGIAWFGRVLVVSLAFALGACSTAPAGSTNGRLAPTTAKGAGTSVAQPQPANADPRSEGDPNAPITVVEYSDFQCPFCGRFVRDTHTKLRATYIDTGKVYFQYRDLPLTSIHPGALLAAHVANCAGAQGNFWPMHDQLFAGAATQAWGQGDSADFNTLLGYAAALELDVTQVQACVQNNQFASQIENDMRAAAALGIRSTPTFVVNGHLLIGAQPFEVWQQLLDDLLAKPSPNG